VSPDANNMLDVQMDSPTLTHAELQGSSRTKGGIFRGKAHGNNPNIADIADDVDLLVPIMGKIHLYTTNTDDLTTWNLAEMKPRTIKHEVTSSFATVMEHIGEKHSPVRSKFLSFLVSLV
jgi:hypothetical protein